MDTEQALTKQPDYCGVFPACNATSAADIDSDDEPILSKYSPQKRELEHKVEHNKRIKVEYERKSKWLKAEENLLAHLVIVFSTTGGLDDTKVTERQHGEFAAMGKRQRRDKLVSTLPSMTSDVWENIAGLIPGRDMNDCRERMSLRLGIGHRPRNYRQGMGPGGAPIKCSSDQDRQLLLLYQKFGNDNWTEVSTFLQLPPGHVEKRWMNHVSQKVSEFVIDRYGSSGVVIDDQGKERFLFQVSDITELVAAIRGVYKLDPSSGPELASSNPDPPASIKTVSSIIGHNSDQVIHIRSLTGSTLTIKFDPSEAVESVKRRIKDEEGVLPEKQRLMYDGKLLEDDRTLSEYNIQKDSILHFVYVAKACAVTTDMGEELEDDDQGSEEQRDWHGADDDGDETREDKRVGSIADSTTLEGWTSEEVRTLVRAHEKLSLKRLMGHLWAEIALLLPGRTASQARSLWKALEKNNFRVETVSLGAAVAPTKVWHQENERRLLELVPNLHSLKLVPSLHGVDQLEKITAKFPTLSIEAIFRKLSAMKRRRAVQEQKQIQQKEILGESRMLGDSEIRVNMVLDCCQRPGMEMNPAQILSFGTDAKEGLALVSWDLGHMGPTNRLSSVMNRLSRWLPISSDCMRPLASKRRARNGGLEVPKTAETTLKDPVPSTLESDPPKQQQRPLPAHNLLPPRPRVIKACTHAELQAKYDYFKPKYIAEKSQPQGSFLRSPPGWNESTQKAEADKALALLARQQQSSIEKREGQGGRRGGGGGGAGGGWGRGRGG